MSNTRRNKPFIFISLAAFALSSLLFFTSLDNKLFDLFLRILPSLTENEEVIILTLDDDSINLAGGFPFRREVMADVVILLKELGVKTMAFDLSYLDESHTRIDPDHAARVFDNSLDTGFAILDEAAVSMIDEIGPSTSPGDREFYKEDILYLHDYVRGELETTLSLLIRDVDEYFAKALAFSGSSWLTLTMIRPEDTFEFIMGNTGRTVESENIHVSDPETDRYLAENIAFKNISSERDSRTPEMAGVMPAISRLLSRSRGAGFVNAIPDTDGLRRRVHLLLKYNDLYYRQLSLAALQEKLGYTSIDVTDKAITLINHDNTELRIPRAEDGSILIKWPKKTFYDYNVMSLVELVQYTMIEPFLVQNMALMHDSGFFYYQDGKNPYEYYLEAEEIKNSYFAHNSAAAEDWFAARRNFFDSAEAFLFGPYEEAILADVGDYGELADYVRNLFDGSRRQWSRLNDIRSSAIALNDSLVIIGVDATSMTDIGLTTFQEAFPLVGTYATIVNMLLSGEFLDDAPWYISAVIALLYSLLLGFLLSRFDTLLSMISGISGLVLLSAGFAAFFWISKIYIGFAVPLAAAGLGFISIMVFKSLTASREKAFLHGAFSRYIASEIITEIINNPDKLNLGGEKREMTAIFTDIQGFSTISEKLDPVNLVKLLNRYLTAMSNIIMENLGTIDKYEGDAIIAFYGAPLHRADHAALACRSALAMKAAERELNKIVLEEGLSPTPLFTRIGINTGEMVVGNMGAENKMDYTIMGNAVNLAARLEGVNKQYRTGGILLSDYTHDQIGSEFVCRRLDRVRVVGIHTPLRLYELLYHESEMDDMKRKWVAAWEKAIDYLESRQYGAASSLFTIIKNKRPSDRVAGLYLLRSESFKKDPLPLSWDGVTNLTSK